METVRAAVEQATADPVVSADSGTLAEQAATTVHAATEQVAAIIGEGVGQVATEEVAAANERVFASVSASVVEPAGKARDALIESAVETVRSADPLVSAIDTTTATATRAEAAQQTVETAAGSLGSGSESIKLAVGGNAGAGPPGPPAGGTPALDNLPAVKSDPALEAAAGGPDFTATSLPDSLATPVAADDSLAASPVESGAADDASLFDVLGPIAPSGHDTRLLTAGIVTMAGVAILDRASGPCLSSASVMLTNVRLMPCMAAEVVTRSVVVAQSAAGTLTGSAGSAISSLDWNSGLRHRWFGETLEGLGTEFHDGFLRGAGRLDEEISEAERNARILRQLGYALGFVYAAFLGVWFWATRIRWQARD